MTDAVDVIGHSVGSLMDALRASNGVIDVREPLRANARVPIRLRCELAALGHAQALLDADGHWRFGGCIVPLTANDKEIQLRPSSTLLQLFGAPGGARDWWVVPARRLEGSIRCLSGDSLGSLSDGTPLLAIQAYQTPNLLLQCDEWGEPLLCDWASFDADFPGSRDRIDALGPVLPNRTEALQPLLPAVRELHRQAKAGDLRARPLSVIELCRHVGLEVSETACADAHLLALARKSVPALQFAHVLRGESPDRSLKALLHGQWATATASLDSRSTWQALRSSTTNCPQPHPGSVTFRAHNACSSAHQHAAVSVLPTEVSPGP